MSSIAVSVIIPVYNVDNYLKKCLDSVQNQTLRNIEIVVIDDGSTDGSAEICDLYQADTRFTIVHNKNQGPSGSRNDGIDRATGEYCMFVDSDDWLEPTACEDMYRCAKENNSDLVIGGHVNESTAESKERYIFSETRTFEGEEYKNEILVHTLGLVGKNLRNPAKLDKLTPVWARLYRLDIIKENKIRYIALNTLPSECHQFNFEFCVYAKTAAFLHTITYHYRRNTSISVTKPYRNDLWSKWKWWIDYEEKFLRQQGAGKELWDAYYSRICCGVIPLGGNAVKLKSYKEKRNECESFLRQEKIKYAFSKTDFSACPVYWRLFFMCAKSAYVDGFLLLTMIMRILLRRRKV